MSDALSVAEKMRLSEPTTKIWMKIDPYCRRQNVGQWLQFMAAQDLFEYSRRFPGEEASNDSGIVENGNAVLLSVGAIFENWY